MNLEELTTKVAGVVADKSAFDSKVKFDFGDAGKLFINGMDGIANNDDTDAEATISISWDDFIALTQGQLDPTMAFMQGKLKVAGDMSVAMKLQGLFNKLA